MNNLHRCEDCGRMFQGKMGLASHKGHKHDGAIPNYYTQKSDGYERWSVPVNGTLHNVRVHRLAAVAWFGLDVVANNVVHHGAGDEGSTIPWDNREDNLEPMNLEDHISHHHSIPLEDLLMELRRVGNEIGPRMNKEDTAAEGDYDGKTYARRFGSWVKATEAVGFKPERYRGTITKTDIVRDIRRVANKMDKTPTMKAFSDEVEYSEAIVRDRFGRWNKAVEAAGYSPRHRGGGK